jgi:hypothetical protein
VVGHRQPGAIDAGAPMLQLDSADIGGFGASSIGDLLSDLALETSGADGSAPVLLLNGLRISSLAQLRDLPPEALERVEIFSGDTAVRLGQGAQQRVVNLVLRPKYHDVSVEGGGGLATDGGGVSEQARLGLDRIRSDQRLSLTADYEHSDWLLESERPIVSGFGTFQTLVPATDHAALQAVYADTIGGVSASLNASLGGAWSTSRLGPRAGDALLAEPPLTRDQTSLDARIGLTLGGALKAWTWSLVGNASHSHSRTLTDSDTAVDTGQRDLARSDSDHADADLLLFGPVAKLPAGELTASVDLAVDGQRESDLDRSLGVDVRTSTSFSHRKVEASLAIPLVSHSGPFAPIGDLSANFGYGLDGFSNFHSLDNSSVSLIWRPSPRLNFVVSRDSHAVAPTIDQLGAPLLATPNAMIFDFVRGQTANVTLLDGGFPGLTPERDTITSISMQFRPIPSRQLVFNVNFTDTRRQGAIGSPAVASLAFEQAFPARFIRDGAGQLITVDARPVNFGAGEEKRIRWGFNLVQALGSASGSAVALPVSAAAGPRRGAGPDERPRLRLSVYHTWRLADRLQLSPGGPELDFLRGDAGPGPTGQPPHEVEMSADLSRGAIGVEVTGTWKSSARISDLGPASDQITVNSLLLINVKLHASGGPDGPLALRGALFSLAVDNLLNSRPTVRDGAGATPVALQPDYLDPLGRTVRVSIRKVF